MRRMPRRKSDLLRREGRIPCSTCHFSER
jgi:hypothetical protein